MGSDHGVSAKRLRRSASALPHPRDGVVLSAKRCDARTPPVQAEFAESKYLVIFGLIGAEKSGLARAATRGADLALTPSTGPAFMGLSGESQSRASARMFVVAARRAEGRDMGFRRDQV